MERIGGGWDEHLIGIGEDSSCAENVPSYGQALPSIRPQTHETQSSDPARQPVGEGEERYRYTIALSSLIAWTADPLGGILEVDVRGLELLGLTSEQARGQGFFTAIHPEDRLKTVAMWRRNAALGHPIDNDVRMLMKDGTYRWHRSRAAPRHDADGKIVRWYGTIEDVHERTLASNAVRWAADHDALTGVWGRAAFFTALERAIEMASEAQTQIALLLLDIDDFKQVNDQFGHDVGDRMLKEVAGRLASSAENSMVGRLGGDEFALFLARPTPTELFTAIEEAVAGLHLPFLDEALLHRCRTSIGVALYPADGAESDTLRKNADLALYDAKAHGGGALRYFRGEMRLKMQTRLSMLSNAHDALDRDLILPYYQPKIDLLTDRITGFEALLRWNHPGRGVQTPASIAAAFEDTALAIALGERMQAKVLADVRTWLDENVAFGRIAINASAGEFRRQDFATGLLRQLATANIPPTCIELEITESVILSNSTDHIIRLITELKEAGVTIALDDFGTGYASLAHLKQFPVDVLKIDQSFVTALSTCDSAIVRAIVGLGRALDILTVAEGVETLTQCATLREIGCDLAQGYLFSPAVPAASVPTLIEKHSPRTQHERRSGPGRRRVDQR
jgi:diguanylate cyclase (GGDEF)-like protein/PAS domain S-box-containing protein